MSIEVKICGLTNKEDAILSLDYGADYIGFVLYSKSPRGVAFSDLFRIIDGLPGGHKIIGVFVNETRATVEKVAEDCGLYAVQVHGDEFAEEFKDMPVPVWRAIHVKKGLYVSLPEEWTASRYVIDASVKGMYGGTGCTVDWNTARDLAKKHPMMLSGGLTHDNVGDAIRAVRPIGVDVASGVESTEGKKDRIKLKQFIDMAKTESREVGYE